MPYKPCDCGKCENDVKIDVEKDDLQTIVDLVLTRLVTITRAWHDGDREEWIVYKRKSLPVVK